jgi:hypothetical protein
VGGTVGIGGSAGTLEEVVASSSLGTAMTSGGGFSRIFPRPGYQHRSGVVKHYIQNHPTLPTSMFNYSGRAYPDVSMLGKPFNGLSDAATQKGNKNNNDGAGHELGVSTNVVSECVSEWGWVMNGWEGG